jgi:beta-lactamase regulating signal transducer with metallopeptidase domain
MGGAPMLGWFVETTLVASGLAVVAACAGRLRSIGPTARHALWLVVLLKLITPPLFCWPWAADWRGSNWPFTLATTAPHTPVARADDSVSTPGLARVKATTLAELERSLSASGSKPAARGPDEGRKSDGSLRSIVLLRRALRWAAQPDQMARLTTGLGYGWLFFTVLLAVGQALRVSRFRSRLRAAVPAPEFLIDEAERIGRGLGIRVPELLIVPDLHTPLVWCLNQPKLLLPAILVKTLDLDSWRGILIHELAHLRRRDHWVSRLELAAGLIWWWNPVYWLALSRIDAEAELACDAWVVSTLPKDRLAYAEALFNIVSTLSMAKAPAPALGAVSSGRLFERRLTMILHGDGSCRLSPRALLAACLLVLLALPSWTTAKSFAGPTGARIATAVAQSGKSVFLTSVTDADHDEDDDASVAKAKADLKKAEALLKKALADAEKKTVAKKSQADAEKAKGQAKKSKGNVDVEVDFDFSKLGEMIEKEIGGKFGPEFEKKMEEFGEKLEKEIEGKFGPDFQAKMEELGEQIGKEMETKFGTGSDFEEKMKAFGKEMEAKFGTGSEFEKMMKDLGEAKFGTGSELEKMMKDIGKEMEAKFGPDSEFQRKVKQQAEKLGSERQEKSAKSPSDQKNGAVGSAERSAQDPTGGKDGHRERRIAALEAQIRQLAEELKTLKDDK